MTFKANFLALSGLVFITAGAYAQIMDTISYVPVKHGYYDRIVTKTNTKLSTSTGIATMKELKAVGSTLDVTANKFAFGKPVYVAHNVTATSGVTLKATNALIVGGEADAGGTITATKSDSTTRIKGKNIYLPNKNLRISSSIMVDGIEISNPSICPIDASKGKLGAKWVKLDGWDADMNYAEFVVYGCSGTNTKECKASSADKTACSAQSGNSWDDTKCCCNGIKYVSFPTGSSARMCEDNQMCDGETLVNQYLACSGNYSANSPQCICAKGTLADCIKAIYGASSKEVTCLTNNTANTKWPCTCEGYQRLRGSNNFYRNYACMVNAPKASCDLTCEFPEYKEYYNGEYRCCCLDYPYLYGNDGGGHCDYSTPVCQPANQVKRCCCAPNNYYGSEYYVGKAENFSTCAASYYYDDGYSPGYSGSCYCNYGYYNIPDPYGGGGTTMSYFQPTLCACDSSYAW